MVVYCRASSLHHPFFFWEVKAEAQETLDLHLAGPQALEAEVLPNLQRLLRLLWLWVWIWLLLALAQPLVLANWP